MPAAFVAAHFVPCKKGVGSRFPRVDRSPGKGVGSPFGAGFRKKNSRDGFFGPAEKGLPTPFFSTILVMSRAPIVADLTWLGDLTFSATIDKASTLIDSAGLAGPSPVQALAAALAGCMSADVAHILTKGRHPFRALTAHLIGERAQDEPHRFLRVALHFAVAGAVPADAVERALALSREKYCSVWHSMRQDIDFVVTFDVSP